MLSLQHLKKTFGIDFEDIEGKKKEFGGKKGFYEGINVTGAIYSQQ